MKSMTDWESIRIGFVIRLSVPHNRSLGEERLTDLVVSSNRICCPVVFLVVGHHERELESVKRFAWKGDADIAATTVIEDNEIAN